MSSPFFIDPAVVQWVTENLDSIGTNLASASAAAAGPTTGVAGAAADEVSTAVASLFSEYGDEYQALLAKAAAFHDQFTQNLATGGAAYVGTEAANAAQMMEAAIRAPGAAINGTFAAATGRPLIGNGANGTSGVQGTAGGAGGWLLGNGGSGGNSTGAGNACSVSAVPAVPVDPP
ncbi:PE family protein [Mycobacterium terramassiliense]|uniref:PE family protein n=2 Tax=Mycobacterium terramassiliense TaxID=1841859 RepID=A0A2U3NKZ0_9MYCO|nr:PE family protein [Mycobacterium terramassiliense]